MHLDVRSCYSFHDGVSPPGELCRQAAELGFDALGICDVDGIYGLIGFYKAALRYGLRPVPGLALTDPAEQASAAAPRHRSALTPGALDGGPAGDLRDGAGGHRRAEAVHIPATPAATVLARDRDGYSELCTLATLRQLEGRGFDLARALTEHTGHCYVISDRPELLRRLSRHMGPGQLFVRLTPDYGDAYRPRQLRQLKLSRQSGLAPVACTDVRFLRPQDQPVHHVLRAIGQNATLQTAAGVCPRNHYLAAPVELGGYYYDCPEAVANARRLAAGCEVDFELGRWLFPDYPVPGGGDPRALLRELCRQGLNWRYGEGRYGQRHLQRLDYELGVIEALGYTSYFLAVCDIVRAAGRRGIPWVGRGSAANSLVSYLLGLTPVDPIALNMYFERFLNPERKSPPDIDIDFSSKRRDDILKYVYERWGADRVAMISTHVTFRARGAFREVGKVFGLGDREITQIARHLPHTSARNLQSVKRDFPELAGIDLSAEPYCWMLPLASRLNGCPRHLGIHCGGIVIAPGKLTDFTALARTAKGLAVTQYEMFSVEDVGLIKIDLLGNCGLDALEDTLVSLAKRGVRPPVGDLETVVTDPATVEMISEGRTMGCFYIESPGMRGLLKRLRTRTFLEVTAASSVIRPGVAESGMMQEYIRRVRGEAPKQPTHPLMQRLLPETHGVMIYQEDVIKVAHELAGMSLAEADLLRRAMSGKLRGRDAMNEVRDNFIAGCEKNGVAVQSALQIWHQVASFCGYAFCKAHSASFATLSYKVAYLKAHYPAEYMAAVLSHGGGFYGPRAYLSECERLGLRVLPPDVNHSAREYRAESTVDGPAGNGHGPDAVRVGLGVVKGVRSALIERIIRERQARGQFRALPEFIRRTRPHLAELQVLVQCGALDSLGMSRPELMWLTDQELRAGLRSGSGAGLPLGEEERLGEFQQRLKPVLTEPGPAARARLELEHLGMTVEGHPLKLIAGRVNGVVNAADLPRYAGKRVRLLGWCIATKRVDLSRRSEVRDTLALQSAVLDAPVGHDADLDEDERDNPAADLGIIRQGEKFNGRPAGHFDTGRRAMKFMSMEDQTGTFEVTLFTKAYMKYAPVTGYAGPFVVGGVVEELYGTCSINADYLQLLEPEEGE